MFERSPGSAISMDARGRVVAVVGLGLLGLGACRTPKVKLEEMHEPEWFVRRTTEPAAHPARAAEAQPAIVEADVSGEPTRLRRPEAGASQAASAKAAPVEDGPLGQARRKLDAGDLLGARDLIDEELTAPLVAEARALLGAGRAAEALERTGEAIRLAPARAEVLLLHGEASLQVGAQARDAARVEVALAAFSRAGEEPGALFGASRAARWLGRTGEALSWARAGVEAMRGSEAKSLRPPAGEVPERTLAEALLGACRAAREASGRTPPSLVAECEEALAQLLARESGDPWVWTQLARLYLDAGRSRDAQDALERGLDRVPHDPGMPQVLAEAARAAGGSQGVIDAFERLRVRHPELADAWWFPAAERLEAALGAVESTPAEDFQRAERDFRRCRELDAARERECLEREAACRAGAATSLLAQGELSAARAAYESVEELVAGALERPLDPRLPSCIEGLQRVAEAHARRGELETAAEVYLTLLRHQPRELSWARLAGVHLRDASDRLRVESEDLGKAALGEIADERRVAELARSAGLGASIDPAALRAAGEERAARAERLLESSYGAFLEAAAIAPDDLRVLNEAARLAVYLRRDLERAERMLLRVVDLGERQVDDPALEGEEQLARREAWGDAHQTLGILYLEHRKDPKTALRWFERSLEIGPVSRAGLVDYYLQRCRQAGADPGKG
jgi:tetratricopeptide (TPR) repeat protein